MLSPRGNSENDLIQRTPQRVCDVDNCALGEIAFNREIVLSAILFDFTRV